MLYGYIPEVLLFRPQAYRVRSPGFDALCLHHGSTLLPVDASLGGSDIVLPLPW